KYQNFTFNQIKTLIVESYKKFAEELKFESETSIEPFLDDIYSVLIKLSKKKFKKWRLKTFESGLDQLSFKWKFLDGKEVSLTFKLDKLSKLRRRLLERKKVEIKGSE
ncbi:MAG: hypothetical protein ACFFDX_16410, partial [Candidatus Odinarchaeota archaeon]